MTGSLLDIYGLTAGTTDGTAILDDIALRVERGEVHGLVGESGAGKTSIARAILGILPPAVRITGGVIRYDGVDLLRAGPRGLDRLLGTEIALIPQDPLTALNPSRRIAPQITDGLVLKRGMSRKAARMVAAEMLDEVHIADPKKTLRSYPHELSGGMRQRVLIAAAFAMNPRLVIADEPTTALDVTVQKQILRLIRGLQSDHDTSVIFVTHDLGVVAQICDRVTVLFGGRVMESAPVADLFANPRHPYTEALIRAVPRYDRPQQSLRPIPGDLLARLAAETGRVRGGGRNV